MAEALPSRLSAHSKPVHEGDPVQSRRPQKPKRASPRRAPFQSFSFLRSFSDDLSSVGSRAFRDLPERVLEQPRCYTEGRGVGGCRYLAVIFRLAKYPSVPGPT